MRTIKIGDKVKIKNRADWPAAPGYKLANSEGEVTALEKELGFVTLRLDKTKSGVAIGSILTFRLENVEKL